MTKINRFLPAFEKGHFDGLVVEGKDLRQSLLYKQILPRPVRRSFSEGGTPSWLKTSLTFAAKNPFNQRNPRLVKEIRVCNGLYNCRETFTDVMSALQITLFMQNKANFQKVKSNVNKVLTRGYDQLDTWSIRKTKPIKANSKPIQSQFKANSNPNKPNSDPQTRPWRAGPPSVWRVRGKMLLYLTTNPRRKSLGSYTDEIEAPNAGDRPVETLHCSLAETGFGRYVQNSRLSAGKNKYSSPLRGKILSSCKKTLPFILLLLYSKRF